MLVKRMLDEYFDWMCDLMCVRSREHRVYIRVLHDLYQKPFIYSNYLDKNRELDGYFLRGEFLFDNGYDQNDIWDSPVSVLEVMVAMSKRIETEIMGEIGNDHIERWFWVMFNNLGLCDYGSNMYDREKVNDILETWLSRGYSRDGHGGIFPLNKCAIDQREIDIWYQMQLYLTENYEF